MPAPRAIFIVFFSALLLCEGRAQQKFDPAQLNDMAYGPEVAAELNTIEVEEYDDTLKQRVYLKNGFRSAQFANEKEWLSIKDTVFPYRVDIVYSKYPLRNGVYLEIYPLLLSRIRSTIVMDPALNSNAIQWNKIWQTHCENDAQVSRLFHGVVIWYRLRSQLAKNTETVVMPPAPLNTEPDQDKLVNEQQTFEDLAEILDNIKSSAYFPDSLKEKLYNKKIEVQIRLMREYYEKQIARGGRRLSEAGNEEMARYQAMVDELLQNYHSSDFVVLEVLNRHPEWKNMLIINDWTGSMYNYGAQVLQWHLKNFQTSGMVSLTLFNDGDFKKSHEKKPGSTGGIYTGNAGDLEGLYNLFHMVMLRGSGGDSQENDVEAILKAMETYTAFSEVVLIADNNACVRDIELADRIGKPVRVILCGYDEAKGANPDLVYLAKKTGGGIYTIEDDLENLRVETGSKGEILSQQDERFKTWGRKCGDAGRFYEAEWYTRYRAAMKNKKTVRKLKLENNDLKKIPKGVFKLKKLNALDLSHNSIEEISPRIAALSYLKILDLSNNRLQQLPAEIANVRYIETLSLAGNGFSVVPAEVLQMRYLLRLNLSNNRIRSMDSKIQFKKAELIDLSNNQLKELPSSLFKLKKLRLLDLSNNQLKSIPDNLQDLSRLEELNLENNKLNALPENLSRLRKLKVLRLTGNDIALREQERLRRELPNTYIYF